MINIQILNENNFVLKEETGTIVNMVYDKQYNIGDKIKITLTDCKYIVLKLSEQIKESIVYIPGGEYIFDIPHGEHINIYAPLAWTSSSNTIFAKEATDEEIYSYRNLALNSNAQRFKTECFPYASANFVTRDEPWFEERNSIDGIIEQGSHGSYPYQSYAGGAREDIDYTLYFGTKVEVSSIILYLRADFKDDHDTYWKSLNVEFSDGTILPLSLNKPTGGQEFKLNTPVITDKIHLCNFKQAANPLSWAALTQIEVFGKILK